MRINEILNESAGDLQILKQLPKGARILNYSVRDKNGHATYSGVSLSKAKSILKYRDKEDLYCDYILPSGRSNTKKCKVTEGAKLKEDWGSSDWTALFRLLGQELSNGASLQDAAETAADFFHQHMGYSYKDAVDVILGRWESIGKERQSKYLQESERHYYTDARGHEWLVTDEGKRNLTTGEEFNLDGTPVWSDKERRQMTKRAASKSKQDTARHYYKVSFPQKEKAKELGMRWDPEKKLWWSSKPDIKEFKKL